MHNFTFKEKNQHEILEQKIPSSLKDKKNNYNYLISESDFLQMQEMENEIAMLEIKPRRDLVIGVLNELFKQ